MEQLRPRIIYVIGGPGGGKGTQCASLIQNFGFRHISIGDLMRTEINAGTEEGRAVEAIVKSGNLVPKEMTVALLLRHLGAIDAHTVLIDGFPRSLDQAIYLQQITTPFDFILYFETDREDVLVNRLIERGKTSGRADDNATTIVHRFQVYKSESVPVIKLYEPFNIIRSVDCLGSIKEVYERTLRALRPEVFFVVGPTLSGKTTVASRLATKYKAVVLDISEIAQKKVKNKWVKIEDDYELAEALVAALQALQHDYRAVVKGFPRNRAQARRFAAILGPPNKVIYLKCSKGVSQARFLAQSDPGSLQVFNRAYEEFSGTIQEVSGFYKEKYFEIETDLLAAEEVCEAAARVFQPEVVLVRGEVKKPFLEYLRARGFRTVNAANLLKLWRQGRGLSQSTSAHKLSDDRELVDLLRRVFFSGAGTQRFALYNFMLQDANLFDIYEASLFQVSRAYFLYSGKPPMPDEISLKLFARGKVVLVDVSRLSSSADQNRLILDQFFQEMTEARSLWGVTLLGPTLTGKSEIAKRLGLPVVDYASIVEEHKALLSTEEEAKQSLTFSEFLDGFSNYVRARSGRVVLDGLPPAEILQSPGDPKFADIPPLVEAEDEELKVQAEENPQFDARAEAIGKRAQALLARIPQLMVVELSAPLGELYARARSKHELGPEDPLPEDLKSEIIESCRVSERLSVGEELVPDKIPRRISLEASRQAPTIVEELLRTTVILVKVDVRVDRLLQVFFWRRNLFYVDMETLPRGTTPLQKVKLILQRMEARPLRDRIVVINNFTSDKEVSAFSELMLLEEHVGRVQALISFSEHAEELDLEQLPVRKRAQKAPPKPADDDEAAPPEQAPEEPREEAKWNGNQPTSFVKAFYNFRGLKGERLSFQIEKEGSSKALMGAFEAIVSSDTRFTIQVTLNFIDSRRIQTELSYWDVYKPALLNEPLAVDINQLHNQRLISANILEDPDAKVFYQAHMQGFTIPFTSFWKHFSERLQIEDIPVTRGIRSAVKKTIDRNGNGFVDLYELNRFFVDWKDEFVRPNILALAADLESKKSQEHSGSYLLIVEASSKDPDSGAVSFERGKSWEIHGSGLPTSGRYCGDHMVYLGKKNKAAPNDIEFQAADTRIAQSHCALVARKNGLHLIDNAGVQLQVRDFLFVLFADAVIQLGDVKLRVRQIVADAPRRDDFSILLDFRNMPKPDEGDPLLVLEVVEGDAEGLVVTLNAENKKAVIGSFDSADLVLQGVEGLHACIELKPVGWTVEDLHSVGGTWLSVNTFERMSQFKTSFPLRLFNNSLFRLPGALFRVVSLQEGGAVELGEPGIRKDSFRRLYRLGKYIAPGGKYKEYECTHKATKSRYAVVVIPGLSMTDDLRRFLLKVSQLRHPNVQQVIELIQDKHELYVVTELFSGQLYDQIEGFLTEALAASYFKQLLAGVAALHSLGIAHKNISPETVRVASDRMDRQVVKLTGFVQARLDKRQAGQFAAPEALKGKPTPLSDIWSCGVLLYLWVNGSTPFEGPLAEVAARIEAARVVFAEERWAGVSSELKKLVRSVVKKGPRPSAEELLVNKWVSCSVKYLDMTSNIAVEGLKQLKKYRASSQLQHAMMMYVAKLEASKEENEALVKLFQGLDQNSDGKLSRNEIMDGFKEAHVELSEGDIEGVIRALDADMSGQIDFREFMTAVTAKRVAFNAQKVEELFQMFDEDASGGISGEELRNILGSTQARWEELIKKVDSNEDGKIDLREFKTMLLAQAFYQ